MTDKPQIRSDGPAGAGGGENPTLHLEPQNPPRIAYHDPNAEHGESPQILKRPHALEIDRILGHPFRVLDSGFIRVVDYMGSDASVVQAARVSYGEGTKRVHEDSGLIRYLLRHGHTTPFEMCEIKLHVRVPMDTWRQWIRHRTASVNEYSTRYSVAIDATQRTQPNEWRSQSTTNRQGSADFLDIGVGQKLSARERELQELSRDVYEERLLADVAREQARKDLPLSTYTEAYWKVDLHNLLRFLQLRMDAHAQKEIREYATVIGEEIVARWVPATWQAFLDYQVHATTLSRLETLIIRSLVHDGAAAAMKVAADAGLLTYDESGLKTSRERVELEQKIVLLGHTVPWVT